jgi:hypothetical protein
MERVYPHFSKNGWRKSGLLTDPELTDTLFFVGLIEPDECFHASGRALVGRTVVYAEEKFPIRLMNITSEPQYSGRKYQSY